MANGRERQRHHIEVESWWVQAPAYLVFVPNVCTYTHAFSMWGDPPGRKEQLD